MSATASAAADRDDVDSTDAGDDRTAAGSTKVDPAQIGGYTRLYEKEFPEEGDLVVVNVKAIEEMGAYVELLEYNNIEGMILLSELSRRRIRSINRLLRVGRQEVVMVIRADREKGIVDLSKRRVAPEDIVKAEERFKKSKAVHSIVKHISSKLKTPILGLYTRLAWPLYRKYGHAYDAFQVAVSDPDTILGPIELSAEERAEVLNYIKLKMTPKELRIRADIQVTCVTYAGIEAIRSALLCAEACGTDKVPIKVQLIAPPLYVMLTSTLDKAAGIDVLNGAIAAAKAEVEKHGGQLAVKKAPTVTSSRDDSELQRMLEDLEMANEEVSGDEDSDEDEEEEGSGSEDEAEGTAADAVLEEAGAAGIPVAVEAAGGAGASPKKSKKAKGAAAADE